MAIGSRPVKRVEDFQLNPAQNFVLESQSAAPGTVTPGRVYYDPTEGAAGSLMVGTNVGSTVYRALPLDVLDQLAGSGIDLSDVETFISDAVTGNTETGIAVTWDGTGDKLNFVVSALNLLPTPTADLAMGGFKITGLADPTGAQHAATQNYVETRINALIGAAPGTLDTLEEIAEALNDDAGAVDAIIADIAGLDTRLDAIELNGGPVKMHAATVTGNGALTEFDVTGMPFAGRDYHVAVYSLTSPYEEWDVAVEHTSGSAVKVGISPALANGVTARVVVLGK
jgi:hypothetical protein